MSAHELNHEALAIAYLTGQASDHEIESYQDLFATDSAFRDTVRDVEMWLAPMNEDVADMAAPDGLLEALLADINAADAKHDTQNDLLTNRSEANVSAENETNAANDAANDNETRKWKRLSLVASLVAVAAVISNFINFTESNYVQPPPPTRQAEAPAPINPGQQFLALLSADKEAALVAIVYNKNTGTIVAQLSNIDVPDGKDLQLWLIREGNAAPQSLGVMTNAGSQSQLALPVPTRLQEGTDILAISLEEAGGSASGGPEGPVLFTGAVSEISRGI